MKRELIVSLLIIFITFAVFLQVRNFDFVRYDDDKYVTENHHIQSGLKGNEILWAFKSLDASNWHPVTWLSHMLDYQLYGLNPKGHHLTNVFLHIFNALLLFLVFRQMSGALWQSAFIAALFALHPLHVESVAWVAERKDVLSTLFFLLTLWSYLHYIKEPGFFRYVLIILFFALGLMSKPMLVTLPFVMLLLDYWPLRRFPIGKSATTASSPARAILHLCWEKIPLFTLSALSVLATLLAQQSEIVSVLKLPLSTRFANGLVAYVTYIEKMFWPQNLAVLYPYAEVSPLWKVAGAGLILILITYCVIKLIQRFPYLATGWFWYLGTLVPVIGIVQVGVQSHADRYTYVPLIGIFIMIAWGTPDLMKKWRYRTIVLAPLAGMIILALAVVSMLQLQHWQNTITLFDHTLRVTNNNYVIHSNMGASLVEQGKLEEAIAHYTEALRIKPEDAEIRYNFANSLAKQGKMKEAVVQYSEVLRIEPGKAAAHNNIAIALSTLGEREESVEHLREALRIKPDYEEAQVNLKVTLERQNKAQETGIKTAAPQVVDAKTADGQMRLGISLLQKGNVDGAAVHFAEALKINPRLTEAHISLGLIMAKKQHLDKAIYHFREALKINPNIAEAHNSLGVALIYKSSTDEAIKHFQEALRINPKFAKAHNSLAVILAQKGRNEEAVVHLKEALRINPDYEDAKRNLKIITGDR